MQLFFHVNLVAISFYLESDGGVPGRPPPLNGGENVKSAFPNSINEFTGISLVAYRQAGLSFEYQFMNHSFDCSRIKHLVNRSRGSRIKALKKVDEGVGRVRLRFLVYR